MMPTTVALTLLLTSFALLTTKAWAVVEDEGASVIPSSTASLAPSPTPAPSVECCDALFYYDEKFYVGFHAPTATRSPTPEEYDRLKDLTFDFAAPFLGPVWPGYPDELRSYSIERTEYEDCQSEDGVDFIAFFVGDLLHAHCFHCDFPPMESGVEVLEEGDMRFCNAGCDHNDCFDPYSCHYRHLRLNEAAYLNTIVTELSDTPFAHVESLSIGTSQSSLLESLPPILPCESSAPPSYAPLCCDGLYEYEEKFYVGFSAPAAPQAPGLLDWVLLEGVTFDYLSLFLGPVADLPNKLKSLSIERVEDDDCQMEDNIDFVIFFVAELFALANCPCSPFGATMEGAVEGLDNEGDMQVCPAGCDHDFCFEPFTCHYRHLRLNQDDYLNMIRTELADTPFAHVESLMIGSADGFAETILPCEVMPTTVPTTLPTTVPTTLPTTVPTTLPTTVPTTTVPTTLPTRAPTPFTVPPSFRPIRNFLCRISGLFCGRTTN